MLLMPVMKREGPYTGGRRPVGHHRFTVGGRLRSGMPTRFSAGIPESTKPLKDTRLAIDF